MVRNTPIKGEQTETGSGIDVIIPVWKPGKELRDLLLRLLGQTMKPDHILLINTEESFFDPGLIRGLEKVSVIHVTKAEFDHGGTRRMAASLLDGPFFLCMTQDAMPADDNLIAALHAAFSDDSVGAAYARQLPKKNCTAIERLTRQFNYGPKSIKRTKEDLRELGIKTYFCSNVCAMYRRSLYEQLGGFVEKTIFNEDMIYAASVISDGKAVCYCADARVYHSHNYSGKQQFHRNFDLGVSHAEYPEVFGNISSEREGARLVKRLILLLIRQRQLKEIPAVLVLSISKYAGYWLGKHYRSLPRSFVLRCTGNRDYWRENLNE